MEQNEKSLSSQIWGNSWFILNAMMTAVSLINLGRDLKPALIRWAELFLKGFEVVGSVRDFVLAPFTGLFSLFKVQIPLFVKNVCFIVFLFLVLYLKSFFKATGGGKVSMGSSSDIVGFLFSIILTVPVGLFIWLTYSFLGVKSTLILLIAIALIFMNLLKARVFDEKTDLLRRNYLKEYAFSILSILFLIVIGNYIIITFGK